YKIIAWHDKTKTVIQEVTVPEGENSVKVDFTLVRGKCKRVADVIKKNQTISSN
ncbi:MAG: hypothetical protein IIB13_05370, partial [Chloroflexi bacterium]|nr:hypothetical protein [Chloroflexota bacterium]